MRRWGTSRPDSERTPSVLEVKALMAEYGVTPEDPRYETVLMLTRQAQARGWWRRYDDLFSGAYIELEAEASEIRVYEAFVVRGRLQTPGYARLLQQARLDRARTVSSARRERVSGRRSSTGTSRGVCHHRGTCVGAGGGISTCWLSRSRTCCIWPAGTRDAPGAPHVSGCTRGRVRDGLSSWTSRNQHRSCTWKHTQMAGSGAPRGDRPVPVATAIHRDAALPPDRTVEFLRSLLDL